MPDNLAAIKQMLEEIDDELAFLAERRGTLEGRKETLEQWLEEEAPAQAPLPINGQKNASPLSAFLQSILADGNTYSTTQLADLAREKGFVSRKKSAKRVVNIALQGLNKNEIVKRTSDGQWIERKQGH